MTHRSARPARTAHSKPRLFYTLILSSIFFLSGCVNALIMDTGRALQPGDTTVTSGFGAGAQTSEITSYVTREAQPAEPSLDEPLQSDVRVTFPLTTPQVEWFYRWSRGTGAGFQVDWAITMPTPVGLGGSLGLKWQLPLPSDTLSDIFAISLVARGAASIGGTESAGAGGIIVSGAADPGLILSIHPGERHAIYLSPRVRWDLVYSRLWSDDSDRDFSNDARSWSGAIGWKFDGFSWGGLLVEAQAIHTPQSRREDGLRFVVGFARVQRF